MKRQYPDTMREEEAAAYLAERTGEPFGPTALRGKRQRRTGPAHVIFGDWKVRYRKADLDEWLKTWVRRVEPKESGE